MIGCFYIIFGCSIMYVLASIIFKLRHVIVLLFHLLRWRNQGYRKSSRSYHLSGLACQQLHMINYEELLILKGMFGYILSIDLKDDINK
jgi:hypothetical protein